MKIAASILAFAAVLTFTNACAPKGDANATDKGNTESNTSPKSVADLSKLHKATFAQGCFWCVEAVFESIKGVEEVVSGYSGGQSNDPTYEEIGGGRTGHAESVEVYYDSSVVDFPSLLRVYFAAGDPTQVNGQGPDRGTQYRSIIFYRNATEKRIADQQIASLNASGKYKAPISVEVTAFEKFWKAEAYHQDYVPAHPENPYVQHESIPRLQRAQAQVKDLLKAGK